MTLSFRSTEFIDDALRDSKATNELEIKELGWALGQISEMEQWYGQLRQDPSLLGGKTFNVTGYSLGGHLATAFNLLRREEAAAGGPVNPVIETYTFNGAGVGGLRNGSKLSGILAEFNRLRVAADITQTPEWNALSPAERIVVQNRALSGQLRLDGEWTRLLGIDAAFAFETRPPRGEQSALQYQLAAVIASRNAIPVTRAPWAFSGVNWIPTEPRFVAGSQRIPGMTEIVGSDAGGLGPSFVANSGVHYGDRAEIYVEDQPITRGSYSLLLNQGALASNPAVNDFADTHSLVLLVDSLSLLAAFEALDPDFTAEDGAGILAAMSSARADSVLFTQGGAEGDTLERTLDALRALVLGPNQAPTVAAYALTLAGNTWHQGSLREPFHANLAALRTRIGELTAESGGSLRVVSLASLSPESIVSLAKDPGVDGAAYRYALRALNPFAVVGFDYASHNTDGELELFDESANPGSLTSEWLDARADMLAAHSRYNTFNGGTLANVAGRYEDRRLAIELGPTLPGFERTLFGGDAADTLSGSFSRDRIFGESGADSISGGGSADHLEGGIGDDWLQGGSGDDVLLGGAGFDFYAYNSGDGLDSIEDADGQGAISYKGRLLAGGESVAPDVYEDDAGTRYRLVDALDGNETLYIDGALAIENFESGDLGIFLGEAEFEADRPETDPVRFYVYDNYPTDIELTEVQRRAIHPSFAGSNLNDSIIHSGGGFATRGGDDVVVITSAGHPVVVGADAGAGNDLIDASEASTAGDTQIAGGAGDDYLIGSSGTDFIYGDNHRIDTGLSSFAAMIIDSFGYDLTVGWPASDAAANANHVFYSGAGAFGAYLNQSAYLRPNLMHAEASADILAEGWHFPDGLPGAIAYLLGTNPTFDDYIEAGGGADRVDGGSGSDIVYGGDGDDHIGGDYDVGALTYQKLIAHLGSLGEAFGRPGDDYLDGGTGDDTIRDFSEGSDTLIGGDGDDRLFASSLEGGLDVLIGGEGDDLLDAWNSHAFADGGVGNDTYRLRQGVIRDAGGEDALDSTFIGFNLLQAPLSEFDEGFLRDEAVPGMVDFVVEKSGDDLVGSYSYPTFELPPGVDEVFSIDDLVITMQTETLVFAEWFLGAAHQIEQVGTLDPAALETWGSFLTGGFEAGSFNGGAYTDRISGSPGNDFVFAADGDDLISGRHGDDLLDGGAGNDTYYYSAGHGEDVIMDRSGTDVLRLAAGIDAQDVTLSFEDSSLVIHIPSGSVELAGVGPRDIGGDLPIDRIVFMNGEVHQVAALAATVLPPGEADPPPDPALEPLPASGGGDTGGGSAPVIAVASAGIPLAVDAAVGVSVRPDSEHAIALAAPSASTDVPHSRPVSAFAPDPPPAVQSDLSPTVGVSSDPVYREIDARLDVLLQAGRSNLSERYAQAVEEFERRRTGTAEPVPESTVPAEEVGHWNEAVHAWHALHPVFDSADADSQDGVWNGKWGGIAGGGSSLDDLLLAGTRPAIDNPHALRSLSGAQPAPGLGEGFTLLRG